jgi:hypothetical protein
MSKLQNADVVGIKAIGHADGTSIAQARNRAVGQPWWSIWRPFGTFMKNLPLPSGLSRVEAVTVRAKNNSQRVSV